MILVLAVSPKKQWSWSLPCYLVTLGAILLSGNSAAHWSPYYFITVNENYVKENPLATNPQERLSLVERPAGEPPIDVHTMRTPPIYTVKVNQDFYQMHGTVDINRYDRSSWQWTFINNLVPQYALPYQLTKQYNDVLVLGAGGGMDVETALLFGVKTVHAVEIDPVIPRLSDRYSSSAPYTKPQVILHLDDARAFLQKNTATFDLVVFGFLDSQALFSYGASLRLDGYTYTVQSFRKAFEHVREGGVMSVSFFVGRPWMAQKLIQMIEQATGKMPFVYISGGKLVMVAQKGTPTATPPRTFFGWQLVQVNKEPVDLATDDWPYLYLQQRGIPQDYTIVIGLLVVISIIAVIGLRGVSFGASDFHFFFMGLGFLLLQTKSIGDCSLYFGTTWFVTTLVITGVLLMVLLANWTALRFIRSFTPLLYLPLFITLAVLLFVPRDFILGQSFSIRLIWTLLAVPLPIYFAGLIFSSTFREGGNPSLLFGANLIGATIGGFCEYLGMWIGSEALSYIVIAAYLASLTSILLSRRGLKIALPISGPVVG